MLIFYADDDVDDREILSEAFNMIDPHIQCSFANNGKEALNHLAKSNEVPDYIFLDLNMPVMNGKQCLIELKRNSQLKDIPVIIYSTNVATREETELYSLGARSVIMKPNTIDELKKNLLTIVKLIGRATAGHA